MDNPVPGPAYFIPGSTLQRLDCASPMGSVPSLPNVRSLRGRTFAARWSDRYGVFVHGVTPPTVEDWNSILAMWSEIPDIKSFRVLVFSQGAAPNAVQRAELSKVLGAVRPRIAVVTSSLLPRMAGKAFALFIPEFRVFDVNQLDAALSYLELGSDRARVERTLSELRQDVQSALIA